MSTPKKKGGQKAGAPKAGGTPQYPNTRGAAAAAKKKKAQDARVHARNVQKDRVIPVDVDGDSAMSSNTNTGRKRAPVQQVQNGATRPLPSGVLPLPNMRTQLTTTSTVVNGSTASLGPQSPAAAPPAPVPAQAPAQNRDDEGGAARWTMRLYDRIQGPIQIPVANPRSKWANWNPQCRTAGWYTDTPKRVLSRLHKGQEMDDEDLKWAEVVLQYMAEADGAAEELLVTYLKAADVRIAYPTEATQTWGVWMTIYEMAVADGYLPCQATLWATGVPCSHWRKFPQCGVLPASSNAAKDARHFDDAAIPDETLQERRRRLEQEGLDQHQKILRQEQLMAQIKLDQEKAKKRRAQYNIDATAMQGHSQSSRALYNALLRRFALRGEEDAPLESQVGNARDANTRFPVRSPSRSRSRSRSRSQSRSRSGRKAKGRPYRSRRRSRRSRSPSPRRRYPGHQRGRGGADYTVAPALSLAGVVADGADNGTNQVQAGAVQNGTVYNGAPRNGADRNQGSSGQGTGADGGGQGHGGGHGGGQGGRDGNGGRSGRNGGHSGHGGGHGNGRNGGGSGHGSGRGGGKKGGHSSHSNKSQYDDSGDEDEVPGMPLRGDWETSTSWGRRYRFGRIDPALIAVNPEARFAHYERYTAYAALLGLRDTGNTKWAREVNGIRIPAEFQNFRYQFAGDQDSARALAFLRCVGFGAYAQNRVDLKLAFARYHNAGVNPKLAEALPGQRNADIWLMSEVLETAKGYYRLVDARTAFKAAYVELRKFHGEEEATAFLRPLWRVFEDRDQDVAGLIELAAVLQLRSTVGRRPGGDANSAHYESFGLSALAAMKQAIEDGDFNVSLAALLRHDDDYREIVAGRSIPTACQSYAAWLKRKSRHSTSTTAPGMGAQGRKQANTAKYEETNLPSVDCKFDTNCSYRYLPESDSRRCIRRHSTPLDAKNVGKKTQNTGNLNDGQ